MEFEFVLVAYITELFYQTIQKVVLFIVYGVMILWKQILDKNRINSIWAGLKKRKKYQCREYIFLKKNSDNTINLIRFNI